MTLLRSVLFNIWFYGLTILFCLAAPLVLLRVRRAGRFAAHRHAALWARTVLAGLRPILGLGWRVEGAAPPSGACLIAAQHQSTFETLLWAALVPDPCFVVKRELMRVPLFGTLLRAGEMIAVDRAAGAAALRQMLRQGRRAADQGRQIVIFPEGTRAEAGAPVRLHPGVAALAAATGLPVIPVLTDSGRFWGRRSFRKQPGTIRVTILSVLPAALPRDTLMQHLEAGFTQGPPA